MANETDKTMDDLLDAEAKQRSERKCWLHMCLKPCPECQTEAANKALKVLIMTPHIRAYLSVMDPKALEQAQAAAGLADYNPLVDLRDMQVTVDALQQFADNSDPEEGSIEEGTPMHRQHIRARALVERIEAGMVPLMLREDRINSEEDVRERRKAAFED